MANYLINSTSNKFSGDDSARATPVPIPNTEVKPRCGDDTTVRCRGKVAHLQNFSFKKPYCKYSKAFFMPKFEN